MFFTRWSGQRIGTVFILCRKVRPGSEQHRPDTEASQIAEVHFADRILKDEGRVRDGKHIVGADSTLHYPAFLPPGRIIAESFQDTSGKRIYHLRQYQSPTNMDHVRKVEMFHNGEFRIFAKAGAMGVFYADTLVGPNLPNLTYMLSFPDMTALEADWEKFSTDPDWKKLSADSRFKLDPPTVSNVTSLVLRPLASSQV